MNIENALQINNNLNENLNLVETQNNFLNGLLGKAINTGLDIGIRAVLPDFIENQIINIKDNLLKFGLKKGISKSIADTINIGKSAIGIATGNFEDVSQMKSAIKNGGLLDSFSEVFDFALNQIEKRGKIDSSVAGLIRQGKNSILNSVENNIENKISEQIDNSNKIDKYIDNWKSAYNNQDFTSMEKEFKKINRELKSLIPLEKSINEARTIESIHTLIKTNGHNFNLDETTQELIKKLS